MPAGYYRGFLAECNTNNAVKPFLVRDENNSVHAFTGPAGNNAVQHAQQSQIEYSFLSPFVSHLIRYEPQNDGNQVQIFGFKPLFDPWPELSVEASAWFDILPGGAVAFLQGFLVPVEAGGQAIELELLTDLSTTPIPLTAIRIPLANVKTPMPFALTTPVICHQAQIVPTTNCRLWYPELQWFAEATPEQAETWATQPTSHGQLGYHSILRIEAAYSATASVSLAVTAFDGTSPTTITLPSTGGAKQKVLLTPTFNKGTLYTYSGISAQPFAIYRNEFTVYVAGWGRSGPAVPYNLLGGAFDDKAAI
jgi:hypothetical protein